MFCTVVLYVDCIMVLPFAFHLVFSSFFFFWLHDVAETTKKKREVLLDIIKLESSRKPYVNNSWVMADWFFFPS